MQTVEFDTSAIGIAKVYGILARLLPSLKQNKKYVLLIKEYKNKRSLSANGYYWQLVEKMAHVLNVSKDELHEELLRRYGTLLTDSDGDAVKMSTTSDVDPATSGIHCRLLGSSELNGETFYHYVLIKGSRYYDTKEMSCLIDGAVSEAKEMVIQTLTPEQLAVLEYG